MTPTNRLISLFAAMFISATLMADVVYEPLIVSEGFNKDAIAENTPAGDYADSYLKNSISTYYFFATKSVIEAVNSAYLASHPSYFTEEELALTISNGWPDDYRDTIKCVLDAKDDPLYSDVIFLLAPYNQNNILTIRPDDAIGGTGTLKFKKVGCYTRLMFLTVSAKEGSPTEARRVEVDVHFTEGEPFHAVFNLADGLGGQEGHKVCTTNILESGGYFNKNVSSKYAAGKGKACASVFDIEVDHTRLISHIVCTNPVNQSAAIILAVTGMTADMEVPELETAKAKAIENNSFQACWERIYDATSYRIDVAEDPDFQNILADYNNKVIDEGTCAEIEGLLAEHDYYWRVRSVNSEGGQSASSAPMRVRTSGGEVPATDETHQDIAAELESWVGLAVSEIDIERKLYRDGFYNTLCLPFNLSAEEIAAGPLTGAQIYEYVRAEKVGDAQLDIEVSATDHIEAGVPYLVKWNPTNPEIIDGGHLIFNDVYISTNVGQTIGNADEVRFVGNISKAQMENGDHDNLFIGANNTLYWPNTDNPLRGFRAYFQVPAEPTNPAYVPHGSPARIVERQEVATHIVNTPDAIRAVKSIENGQLVIISNGYKYNAQGRRLE